MLDAKKMRITPLLRKHAFPIRAVEKKGGVRFGAIYPRALTWPVCLPIHIGMRLPAQNRAEATGQLNRISELALRSDCASRPQPSRDSSPATRRWRNSRRERKAHGSVDTSDEGCKKNRLRVRGSVTGCHAAIERACFRVGGYSRMIL